MRSRVGLVLVGGLWLAACGSDGASSSRDHATGQAGIGAATGHSSGASGVGGSSSATAGSGGTTAAGFSGTPASGASGATSGGASGTGGLTNEAGRGGVSSEAGAATEGGAPAGGPATGGTPSAGGEAMGGQSSGGEPATGGTASGGTTTGGTATGGTTLGGTDGQGGTPLGEAGQGGAAAEPPGECRIGFPGPPLWPTSGDMPSSTSFADLDGDGLLDMVVTGKDGSHEQGLLSVFKGLPDGYTQRQDFDTGASPSSAAIDDVDGDGDLDVVVASEGSQGSVSVLLNQGDGTLSAPVVYGGGCLYAISLALSDLNGDDLPDAAVACWLVSTIQVRLNDGNGGFGTITTYTSSDQPWAPTGIAAGDVDGDGDADLVTSDDRQAGRVNVFANAGNGTFAEPVHYDASDRPVGIALGDLDGDDKLDIALASAGGYGLDVLLNQGDGTFPSHQTFEIFSYLVNPSSVALRDVNDDGRLDAALSTNNGLGYAVTFVNQGLGTFALDSATDLSGLGVSTSLADATADGIDDLVVGVQSEMELSNASVAVFPGLGDGAFATQIEWSTSEALCNSLVSGDFDHDGLFDMATGCNDSPQHRINIWYGAADHSFTRVDYDTGWVHMSLHAGDLNGDGLTDLVDVSSNSTHNDFFVHLAKPGRKLSGTWYRTTEGDVEAAIFDADLGDMDADGDLDLVLTNVGAKAIQVFFNAGDGSFPDHTDYPMAKNAETLRVGDLNGDGTLDVVADTWDGGARIFSNDGNGVLSYATDVPAGPNPQRFAIVDLDGDHINDLVVSNGLETYKNSAVTLLTNLGDFNFSPKQFAMREAAYELSTGDLNGDGRPDVLVTNGGANAVGVLLSHGSNDYLTRYWPVTEYPHSNLIHDLNADGRQDLAVMTAYSGLRILPQWCW